MGLFGASFAQYLLSLGCMTTDFSSEIRWYHPKKYTSYKLAWEDGIRGMSEGCNGTDYLELFNLKGRDPLVRLIIRRVVKFFAPGHEDAYTMTMAGPSYFADDEELAAETKRLFDAVLAIPDERPEDRTLWNISMRVGKLIAIPFGARYRAAAANLRNAQKELENLCKEHAVLTAPEDNGATMTFQDWETFVDDICNRLWEKHDSAVVGQIDEADEDEQAEDEDEESWELIDI